MAVFSTNFSTNTVGSFPSDWTQEFVGESTSTREVVLNTATGERELRLFTPSTASTGVVEISWNTPGSTTNVETLTLMRSVTPSGYFQTTHRYSPTPNYYMAGLGQVSADTSPTIRLTRVNSGALGVDMAGPTATGLAKTGKLWIRTRVNGTSIQTRTWAFGATEPSTWTLSATDGSITGAGKVGYIWQRTEPSQGTDNRVSYFSVGTNGDSAGAVNNLSADLSMDFNQVAGVVSQSVMYQGGVLSAFGGGYRGSAYAGMPYYNSAGKTFLASDLSTDFSLFAFVQQPGAKLTTELDLTVLRLAVASTYNLSTDMSLSATFATNYPISSNLSTDLSLSTTFAENYPISSSLSTDFNLSTNTLQYYILASNLSTDFNLVVNALSVVYGISANLATEIVLQAMVYGPETLIPVRFDTGDFIPRIEDNRGNIIAGAQPSRGDYTPKIDDEGTWSEAEPDEIGSWNSV